MTLILIHARDRREDIAYRLSLEPDDDVLELKHNPPFIIQTEPHQFITGKIRLHCPSLFDDACGVGWFIASLVALPLSFVAWFIFVAFSVVTFFYSGAGTRGLPRTVR